MTDANINKLNKLVSLHQKVSGLNSALSRLFPVVIVEDDQFLIYDLASDARFYQFIKQTPAPMPIPDGVRAAFQLEDYGGRIVCVVTPDVFDSPEGYVTLLHEFVHCYQYESCEEDLKMRLDIARQARETGDLMWEIEHPFPYTGEAFIGPYTQFLEAIKTKDSHGIYQTRSSLHAYLGRHDYEYMVWQEWKEGFARWVENRIKQHLGLPKNKGGGILPYSRVLFYYGGAAYIEFLSGIEPGLVEHLPNLFSKMFEICPD